MKKLFEKISLIAATAAVSIIVTACGGATGADIDDQKAIDKRFVEVLKQEFSDDTYITRVHFISAGANSHLTLEMGSALVDYIEESTDQIKTLTVNLGSIGKKIEHSRSTIERKVDSYTKKMLLKDFDFSQIAANIKKGAAIIAAEGYNLDGADSYVITPGDTPEGVIHTFELHHREGSEVTTSGGLGTQINYLAFKFHTDTEGNVLLD